MSCFRCCWFLLSPVFFLPHNSSTSSEHPSTFIALLKQEKTLRSGHRLKFGSFLPATSVSLLLPSFRHFTSSYWGVSSDLWFSEYADVGWKFLESAPKTKVGPIAVHHEQLSGSFTNRPYGFFWHNTNGKDALHFSLKPPKKVPIIDLYKVFYSLYCSVLNHTAHEIEAMLVQ